MRDLEELAQAMFEAHEAERFRVDGDSFGECDACGTPVIMHNPRRWTSIDQVERDRWLAAARVAWKQIGLARLGESTATTHLDVVKGKLREAVDCAMNIKGPSPRDRDEYRGYLNELRAFGEA